MFVPLKTEIESRFAAVDSFFKETRKLKSNEEKTARGLAFVHMYSVYEYSVRTAVQIAIDAISVHAHNSKDLSPTLLALFLDAQLKSLKDCGLKDLWRKRLQLFEAAFSTSIPIIDNQVIPTDGTHYRHTHLQIIFEVLGIKRTPAQRQRHLLRIDEVVNNRNAVAHGRETPDAVGRRYTRGDIHHRIEQMESVSKLFVSAIEAHCANPKKHCR